LQALFLCGYPVTNIVKNVLTIFVDGGSVLSMQISAEEKTVKEHDFVAHKTCYVPFFL
jgi:hypothetical protein